MKKAICILIFVFMIHTFFACGYGMPEDTRYDTETTLGSESLFCESQIETDIALGSETETASKTEETEPEEDTSAPISEDENDLPSLLDFLMIAKAPVGQTMYIWGGGWNEADTGAGVEAVTLGVSEGWARFAKKQDAGYDYKKTRYQIHDGLDCSGFLGWAVYNVLETESGKEGYVMSSTVMAEEFSKRGLGTYIPKEQIKDHKPGDIMSMKGHVWISLGECTDGSVLLLHSSPPGVIFCGTSLPDGSDSEAVKLAQRIMSENYPEWYEKFPDCSRPHSYLEKSSAMRWHREVLTDDEGLFGMTSEEVVKAIF